MVNYGANVEQVYNALHRKNTQKKGGKTPKIIQEKHPANKKAPENPMLLLFLCKTFSCSSKLPLRKQSQEFRL